MERTSPDVRIVRAIERKSVELDKRLPPWARRSHPIIRRQLGMYWKTILPDVGFLVKIVLVQAGLVVVSLPIPFIFDLALPTITASILLLPVAIYMYVQVLFAIGYAAAVNVADEVRYDTFTLLRVTPIDLPTILASKIAAAIWRQVENLGLLIIAAGLFSMPILISQYATIWPLAQYPVLSRLGMVLGLIVSLLRLILEPFMIGALGVMAGAGLRVRSSAVIATAIIAFFYFMGMNLIRFLKLPWPLQFGIEFILPIVLPLLIIWGSLKLAERFITRG
ncbi:MAG: hypothetical protein ABI690_20190 [Chloroflexota bacterium]